MDTNSCPPIREGQPVTLECPYCHMLMRVPYYSADVRATCDACQGTTTFRFVSGMAPVRHESATESILSYGMIVLGLMLIVGGIVLSIGNRGGVFVTLPFAGFITGAIGMAILAAAVHGGE